jgi:membrane protein YqaA with SNARE-associated domain
MNINNLVLRLLFTGGQSNGNDLQFQLDNIQIGGFVPEPATVAGGLLGYSIGALLYDSVGAWLIHLYGYGDKVETFRQAYAQWGAWIILLKGLTPIPYKIVTITSGFAGYNILLFVVLSLITRGMRFFVEAFLLNRYGARARLIIEKRLGLWAGLAAATIVVGFIIVVRVF